MISGGSKMGREYEDEKLFSENIDRLLKGEEVELELEAGEDWRTALDFARRMTHLRAEPSIQFQSSLKARLLQKLSEKEADAHEGWFWRLIPREAIWQTVAVFAVMVLVGAVVWGTMFRNPQSPMVQAPTPSITVAPTTTAPSMTMAPTTKPALTTSAAAPATSAAPTTTTTPAIAAPTYLVASGNTNKSVYQTGETVTIHMTWQNVTTRGLTINEFPPILSVMDKASGQPVFTFAAGKSSQTLAPGEKASYDQVWNQLDFQGRQVAPDGYYIELEEMYFQGKSVPLKLTAPVNFLIEPPSSGTKAY
jgi:hypothetical protein